MKRFLSLFIAAVLFLSALPSWASPTVGTVDTAHPYAWGENLGWLQLAPEEAGLIITDSALTGYAWSRQFGWINFSPSNSGQGVRNTPDGVLSGSAWISGRGWLDMAGVTIDVTGRFRGIAGVNGSAVGRVSFDCATCEVRTDWRPVAGRQSQNPPISNPPTVTPPTSTIPPEPEPEPEPEVQPVEPTPEEPVTEVPEPGTPVPPPAPGRSPAGLGTPKSPTGSLVSYNGSLTLQPNQSGTVIRDLPDGSKVRVNIFSGSAETQFTIDIYPVAVDLHGYDPVLRPVGDFFFESRALDFEGKPLTAFNAPLKITLPLSGVREQMEARGVYWLNEENGVWERLEPVAFRETSATFYTNRLGRFAILEVADSPQRINPLSTPLHDYLPLGVSIVTLAAAGYLAFGFKK